MAWGRSAPNTASGLATTSPISIGAYGSIEVREGFRVNVKVLDSRNRYGTLDFLVQPDSGSGEAWVQADRVTKAARR